MDIAIIGVSDEQERVSGWLADDGHLVRHFNNVADLVASQLARPIQAILLVRPPTANEQELLDTWFRSCDWPDAHRFLINPESVDGWINLSLPLRRRVVLSTLLEF